MKIQTFAPEPIPPTKPYMLMCRYGRLHSYHNVARYFQEVRENGTEKDNPTRKLPEDGDFYLGIDGVFDLKQHPVKRIYDWCHLPRDELFKHEYTFRYYQGPGDKAWMEEKDKNYLERIEREGKLIELEPAIWYLRQHEQATNSIRDWWAEKILLSDLSQVLIQAEIEYKAIPLDDFNLNIEDSKKISLVIKKFPHIKTLDLSYLDFGNRKNLLVVTDFFKIRNDFVEINLSNTNITNEELKELLAALNYNSEIRGIPLIQNLRLLHNRIQDINILITFIQDYVNHYVAQQKKLGNPHISMPDLRLIDLENNLIKESAGGSEQSALPNYFWLEAKEKNLSETLSKCLLNLKIILTSNLISYSIFNNHMVEGEFENRYKFFKCIPIINRRSLIHKDAYLNLNTGCIYLTCRSDAWAGHLVMYTELLNPMGQTEIMRLEFFSDRSSCEKEAASPSKGGVYITFGEVLKLRESIDKGTISVLAGYLKANLMQHLIHNIREDFIQNKVRYSIDGVLGHNCATWILEKLKEIGVHLPPTKIPRKVVPTDRVICFHDKDLTEVFSDPMTKDKEKQEDQEIPNNKSYCLVM